MKKTKKAKSINSLVFSTTTEILPFFPGMHCLKIPKRVVRAFGGTFNIRFLCTVNKKLRFQCGLRALGQGQGQGYIMITKKRLKELSLKPGNKVSLLLKRDKSEYGMKVCEELAEVLRQDDEGKRRFEALKPGKKRNIIHFVGSSTNSDRRIERALKLIENLKLLPEGKESISKIFGVAPKIDF